MIINNDPDSLLKGNIIFNTKKNIETLILNYSKENLIAFD